MIKDVVCTYVGAYVCVSEKLISTQVGCVATGREYFRCALSAYAFANICHKATHQRTNVLDVQSFTNDNEICVRVHTSHAVIER